MFNEVKINIPLGSNLESNGYLLSNAKNKSIVINLHGLLGNDRNFITLKARDFIFNNNLEYDFYRFNFYNNSNNNRSFLKTTIQTQADDLNQIINYFADKYENIYIMAASYGALTAAYLNSNKVTKQVLIDPSFIIDIQWQNANFIKYNDDCLITLDRHIPVQFNEEMMTEGLAWSAQKSQKILNSINKPTYIIQANSIHYKLCANLDYSNKNVTTKYFEKADHSFINLNTCDEMLKSTFNFLK